MPRIFPFFSLLMCLSTAHSASAASGPPISIADATISEGNSGFRDLSFVASIPSSVSYEVTAKAETLDMTAKAGMDYTASTGNRVVIPAGQTSGLLKIRISTDKIEERDEQFRIRLFNPTGGTLLDGDALGTVKDDDYAGQISIGDVSVGEANSGQTLAKAPVRFSQPALHDISVRYEVKDGTAKAGLDYLKTQGTLLFKPGRVALDVLVPVVGDVEVEGNENCFADILVTGLPLQKSRGVVTIVNNDVKPTGKIAYASLRNGGATEIVVMNADGTNLTSLRNGHFDADSGPNLSRDGRKIVFTSSRDYHGEIYIMNVDGTLQSRLTSSETFDNYAPVFSPDASKIAFVSRRDGNDEIYGMNVNGSGQTRLTNNSTRDDWPTYSPDGKRIAFVSQRDGNKEIYVMNANGSGQTRLTNNPGADDNPCFSPDGRTLAFDSDREGAKSQIYWMKADGSAPIRVTGGDLPNSNPCFSPTGEHLVFTQTRPHNPEIDHPNFIGDRTNLFLINTDGTGQRVLSDSGFDGEASWSAGSVPVYKPVPPARGSGKIAFTSGRDNPDTNRAFNEIYVMNADGTNTTRLTTTNCEYTPDFSPDGSKIVWFSARQNTPGIYLMNADGTNQVRLTDGYDPSFSPDGRKIVFVAIREGQFDIYVMNVDGTQIKRVTNDADYERAPSFSPDGTQIVYGFTLNASNSYSQIYRINVDGTNPTALTTTIADEKPSFSPDAKTILFASRRYGGSGVYLMGSDGTAPTRLSSSFNSPDHAPCFSPDGKLIAFVRNDYDDSGIFLINANGTGRVKIPSTHHSDEAPTWGPGSVPAPAPAASPPASPGFSGGSS